MEAFWQDLKYAARGLVKSPGFTLVAVLTLALGIGANTAIFTVVEAVLLRSLPYRDAERLVHLWETRTNRQFSRREASYPNYLDWRAQNTVFEDIAGYNRTSFTLMGIDTPERVSATRVTANMLDVLGVQPQQGRNFAAEEGEMPANPVALVSHGFWQRRMGGRADAIGQPLNLSGTKFTVIGVLPQSFHFATDGDAEVFVPLMLNEDARTRRSFHWFWPIARLKKGVTIEQASTELAGIAERLAQTYHNTNAGTSALAVPLREFVVGDARTMLMVVFAAVTLLLMLACVNVANLLLARGSARARELAIRTALGAAPSRLMRQLLAESLLLAIIGGALASLVAKFGATALVSLLPAGFVDGMPALRQLEMQPLVYGFAALVTLSTAFLFGLGPAWHATRHSLSESLKEGSGAGASRESQRLRSVLVVSQVALALVLLAGTGLVLRSLQQVLAVNPGFRTENLTTFRISLPGAKYQTPELIRAFYSQLETRAAALPGVTAAGIIDEMPLTHDGGTGHIFVEGRPEPPPGQEQETVIRVASAGYFSMLGIPLVSGRFFDERDHAQAAPVTLISEGLAKQLFPGEDPVDRTIYFKFRNTVRMKVVGVVADVKLAGLDRDNRPALYFCAAQDGSPSSWLVVRTAGESGQLAAAVRKEVAALDSELPVYGVRTVEQLVQMGDGVVVRRSVSLLLGAFAAAAVLLAALGLYGVMNYAVVQRTREIGVRMALGAQIRDVLRITLAQGMKLALVGTALGAVAALAAARFIQGLLFGISPADPLTFVAVMILLALVALAACAIPARRATRVDPLVALRYE